MEVESLWVRVTRWSRVNGVELGEVEMNRVV